MLIIFDFDGVLISASWLGLYKAYKALIKTDGKNYKDFFRNLEEFKKWWSPDWMRNNERLKIDNLEKGHSVFYEIANSYIHIFPWTEKILADLSKKHWLALLTNRHRANAEKLLGGFNEYFLAAVGGEDVKKLKPDPEGINLILGKIAADRKNTLVIGDMPDDIKAGRAAGVKTGAVKWGLGDWNDILSLNPDYIFEKYKDLLRI